MATISERLRTETVTHHESIENAKRLSRLGAPDFTLAEYQELLEHFYGFYKPLEAHFQAFPDVMSALDFEGRFKLPLLIQDLKHFGHTDDTLSQLPQCSDFPPMESLPQVLGCIYVMEGSTHGTQFITKRLREHFNLTDGGLRYYEGYGKDTMPRWKTFKTYLDTTLEAGPEPEQAKAQTIQTAGLTFDALHRWMDN